MKNKKTNIVIATTKEWNFDNFKRWQPPQGYKKILITDKKHLNLKKLSKISPQYIFFPHWSWMIPEEVHKNFECVVFHMTNLPFGRGGSPLQNLIQRGIYKTKLSAIKVVRLVDAGPIYLKSKSIDLKEGSAQEIYKKVSVHCFSLINQILKKKPVPKEQYGKVVFFNRRKPKDSKISTKKVSLRKLYDHIRMLDAETYPKAYIHYGDFRLEFFNARLIKGVLSANINIEEKR